MERMRIVRAILNHGRVKGQIRLNKTLMLMKYGETPSIVKMSKS